MLLFWIVCALLVLLALWFVLPPFLQQSDEKKKDDQRAANLLVYQDQYQELEADLKNGLIAQEQYQQEKDELERRLLDDFQKESADSSAASSPTARKFGYGVGAAIPIAAVALYFLVGNPKGLSPAAASTQTLADANQQGDIRSRQQMEANVAKLAQRLQQSPNDAEGWAMLGRSYMILERYSDAASAYGRATALNDKDANVWTDYAEALAMANDRRLGGKPTEALDRALQLDPKNEKALDLAGSAAYQAGNYQKAIDYWQKLLKVLPPGSEELRTISDQIARAKELAGGKGSR